MMREVLPVTLRTNAVFGHIPAEMFQTNIPPAIATALLAKGIPALSGAAGRTVFSEELMDGFDMNTDGKPDDGAWGRHGLPYNERWKHSDMKDMAFFYVHKLFKKLVQEGGME